VKKVEIEFNDCINIGISKEDIIFNVKMTKIDDNNSYDIKVTAKCEDKNRRCSYSYIDDIIFDRDMREVINEWLKENKVCEELKSDLKVKLESNFEYIDIM